MRTNVKEVFAAAAAGYGRDNPLLALERPETAALLPALVGSDVLDVGAGRGHYAALATALGARLAIALDFTPEMAAAGPRPTVVGDAVQLPLRDASMDVIVMALVISFVPDRLAAFKETARVLRPRGCLVLSDLHPVASERGWRRSFTGPAGQRLEVQAPPAGWAELSRELAAAGLMTELRREPVIDSRLEREFRRAGRTDFDSLRGTPLLLLIRARKGGLP